MDPKEKAKALLRKMFLRKWLVSGKRIGFKVPRVNRVEVQRDGHVTAVVVNGKYFGWSKFNPNDDRFSEETGLEVALYRACQKMQKSLS
jgi:hypothetical protein